MRLRHGFNSESELAATAGSGAQWRVMDSAVVSAEKFDPSRAAEYDAQVRIALAGYEAMHELTACCLTAALGAGSEKSVLVVGVGTGQEIVTIGRHEPYWRFTAVDPSPPMIAIARERLVEAGMLKRD